MDSVNILVKQLGTMWAGFIQWLPQLAIAVIVLFLVWLVARFARKVASGMTARSNMRPSLKQLVDTLVTVLIWVLGIMLVLTILLPGLTPAGLFAGLGIGAVAIGFAFQDIFENFLAGVLIMVRRKMRIGDIIECEGIAGKVEHITLRETHVRELSNEITIVPNSMLFKNPVKILTDLEKRRHELVVGVAYDTNLEKAREVIRRAVEGTGVHEEGKPLDIFAQEFNSSSIDFNIRWWAGSTPRAGHESRDLIVRAVKRALDEAGIEIPFPYMTHTFKEPLIIAGGNDDG